MKKILIVCAAALLLAVNAWADTVTFKSGKKVEGNIKSITNDSVTVDLYGVTEMTYDLADIQEINGQAVEIKKPATTATEAPAPEPVAPVTENIPAAPAVTPNVIQQEKIPGLAMGETPKMNLSDKQAKTFLAALGIFFCDTTFILIILYIYSAICLQTIAKKTDTQNGWLAWIPIANLFLMCKIGKVKYIWLLFLLAGFVPLIGTLVGPICGLFLFGFIWYKIALARGKEGWVGAITLIPVVGLFTMGYLAFSKDGNKEDKQGAAPLPNIGGGQPA